MMLVGVVIAAIVGYIAILLVRKLINSNKFGYFAWYCITAGIFTAVLSVIT